MNRRQFLETVAAGMLTTSALAAAQTRKMPTRILGRTKIEVPILAFGSGSRFLMYKEQDRAIEALERAISLGIRYIDTAHAYGNGQSEEWVGQVMPSRRKEVVLATKIPGRTADQGRREIELSLKRLKTDRLDVLHIHALKNLQDLAAIEARGGVLEALYEARQQKIARAIGITCHVDPVALRTALERHDFDCTQMALNAGMATMAEGSGGFKATLAGENSFEKQALPVAKKKNLGVIAMKVFGQEQLIGAAPVEKLITYALSLPVSVASLGMPKLEHIDQNAEIARNFVTMSSRQRRKLEESIESGRKLAMAQFFSSHEDV